MPRKFVMGAGKEKEEYELLDSEDLAGINKRFDEFGEVLKRIEASVPKGLAAATDAHPPTRPEGSSYYCPTCGIDVKDPITHLMSDPEKHGIRGKTVTVEKESKGMTIGEFLGKHDFIDCPECRAVVDAHLDKKGLEITKKKEEKGWSFEL